MISLSRRPRARAVLRQVGAERAACALLTGSDPSLTTRTLLVFRRAFPGVKTFLRAVDADQGAVLQSAGAYVVVPTMLEPSLQMCSAALQTIGLGAETVGPVLDSYRAQMGGWVCGEAFEGAAGPSSSTVTAAAAQADEGPGALGAKIRRTVSGTIASSSASLKAPAAAAAGDGQGAAPNVDSLPPLRSTLRG